MIEVKNLVKKYGNHMAIDHLNFKIEKGRIYGFLGPNGAGKSTTMNIMTGYLGATEGEVIINGQDILKKPEAAKKHIGYLPEQPPLYMEMTVQEYLDFVAELKQIPKQQRASAVDEVLMDTKLMDVRTRLIRNLSKGFRQRVGLAQAVIGFPDIIILDEPTVGLDPKQIIEIRQLIRTLAEKHTIILSSHILAEVREVCDYIMIISKGKLVASDTPDKLEHLMDESEIIELEAKAEVSVTNEILQTIPEITSVETEQREGGVTFAAIHVKGQLDIREKLFFAFADQKCAILMMNTNRASLEDVFLELTQEEKKEEQNYAGDL